MSFASLPFHPHPPFYVGRASTIVYHLLLEIQMFCSKSKIDEKNDFLFSAFYINPWIFFFAFLLLWSRMKYLQISACSTLCHTLFSYFDVGFGFILFSPSFDVDSGYWRERIKQSPNIDIRMFLEAVVNERI